MRKIVFILLLFVSIITFAQEEMSALDKVAKETCEYFAENKVEITKLNREERLTKLGLQMFALYDKYKKELKNEGITVTFDEKSSEDFGEKVGMSMIKFCPDTLVYLSGDLEEEVEKDEELEVYVEGVISSVKGDEISTVEVKDVSGKSQKFLWISNFKGSDRLIDDKKIRKQKVKVYYKNIEVYSPKLQEYIIRKQITRIDYL